MNYPRLGRAMLKTTFVLFGVFLLISAVVLVSKYIGTEALAAIIPALVLVTLIVTIFYATDDD